MPGIVISVPPAEFGTLAVPFDAWTTTENRAMRELQEQLIRSTDYRGASKRGLLSHALIISHPASRPWGPKPMNFQRTQVSI